MKPASFGYAAAANRAEALQLLLARGTNAKFAAGCQSLGPMLNLRLARPSHLVDISTAADLRSVQDEDGAMLYGAAITHAEIEDGVVPDVTGGWLQSIARGIAYRAVRNRGTIGGSLAHADPAADWVVTLTALGAEIVLVAPQGIRSMPMTAFITGALTTALANGELLAGVRIARPAPAARWGYWKFTKKRGEFAKASAAVLIDPSRKAARLVVGAIERAPILLPDAAALLADRGSVLPALEQVTAANPLPSLALHVTAIHRAIAIALATDAEAATP